MKAAQVAPPAATKPPEQEAHAESAPRMRAGWGSRFADLFVVRALRGVFGWRVRFSLRTLLLVVAGLSAGIGARLRFDENPWQLAWHWKPQKGEEVCRAAVSPDGSRMAVALRRYEPPDDDTQPGRVLLFDAPDAKPDEVACSLGWPEPKDVILPELLLPFGHRPGTTPVTVPSLDEPDPITLFFTADGQLRFVQDRNYISGEDGRGLLKLEPGRDLVGISEDGRTALTAEGIAAPYRVWDLDARKLRFEIESGTRWLDGPHSTPNGTRGLALRTANEALYRRPSPSGSCLHAYQSGIISRVDLWDLNEGTVLDTFETDAAIQGAALSRDGQRLVAGGQDFVEVWDVDRHRRLKHFTIDGNFLGGELNAAGTAGFFWICERLSPPAADFDTLRHMRMNTGQLGEAIEECDGDIVGDYPPSPPPAFSADGRCYYDQTSDDFRITDTQSGEILGVLPLPKGVACRMAARPAVATEAPVLLVYGWDGLFRFERVRPEGPERLFWLPEFWLAALFALAVPLSLWRDGRFSPQRTQRPRSTS